MPRPAPLVRSLGLLLALALGGCSQVPRPAPVEVNLAVINDLHGYIQSNPFSYEEPAGGRTTLQAGGLVALGGLLAELRRQDPELLFVGGGDLIGASPPLSALWADEPTLKALDLLGLKLSVVGNHELDSGRQELLRQVRGGCASPRPERACRFDGEHRSTRFPYIAANLIDSASGEPLFAPYRIETVHGVKIAFIGAVPQDLPSMVPRASLAGLDTLDEAEAINAQLPALRRQGVDVIVALVHNGGRTDEPFDRQDCRGLQGEIVEVARRLDPQIELLISAHTHEGYLCRVGDRLVTQASSYGRLLTHLTLRIDPASRRVLGIEARNLLVDPRRYPGDAGMRALEQRVEQRSRALLEKPVARLGAARIPRAADASGESAMGDLVADAQLAATRHLGAEAALANYGGIRGELALEPGRSRVSFGQLAAVQPFGNRLVVLTLSGAQLRELLEQQWRDGEFAPLQVSASLSYRWDASRPPGRRVLPGSLRIGGRPVRDGQAYRIAVNAFLADGGDHFTVLTRAGQRLDTPIEDRQALIDYLQARDRSGAPTGRGEPARRFRQVGRPVVAGP